jgi:hypothetical protein
MKCMLCPAEIDETKEIVPADSISARLTRAAELSAWHQVTVTIGRRGGQEVLLSGHICPDESLDYGSVQLAKKGGKK